MRNLDSGLSGFDKDISKKVEAIQPMAVNAAQMLLIEKMIPDDLRIYVTEADGGIDGAMNEFYSIWIQKYAYLFRKYCDTQMNDQDFLDRIESEKLSEEDIVKIVDFITNSDVDDVGNKVGGGFFVDEEALESFRAKVTH
jgi:hypothetical protein